MQLLKDPHVASFMHGTTVSSLSMKELYRPGTLRKASYDVTTEKYPLLLCYIRT